jgi:20S proteasome alpha/beta subunit
MTVCIGVLCERKSSVILVADRMLTSGLSIEFEHPVSNKVTPLSQNCLALTAGDALAHTELFNAVSMRTGNLRYTTVEDIVAVVKEQYQRLRHQRIVDEVLMPRAFSGFEEFYHGTRGIPEALTYNIITEIERYDYGLTILIGGATGDEAHIYEVSDPGTSRCVDSVGFHAIGSGTNLAMSTLIADKCHQELQYIEALHIAVNAKLTSENAPGVGRKTDICLVRPRCPPIQFSDSEITELKELVRRQSIDETGDHIADLVESATLRTTQAPPRDSGNNANSSNQGEDSRDGSDTDAGGSGSQAED